MRRDLAVEVVIEAIRKGVEPGIAAGQRSHCRYDAALDEAHRDCSVRSRPVATDLQCATRTQHESLAAVRDLRRRREGTRHDIWSGRTDQNQSSTASTAARRLEDACCGQLATAAGKCS